MKKFPALGLAKTFVEILEFKVNLADQADFVAIDQAIWTTGLAAYPAFLAKEIWLEPQQPTLVTVVIYWSDREQWKAISSADLAHLQAQFEEKFNRPYQLVGEREYSVIKKAPIT
jgi:uncharacterized protein (TIGR03792 family)